MQVIKRDQTTEPLDLEKIHKMVFLACEGVEDVSPSLIEMNSKIQLTDGISTEYIQNLLVTSANNLITIEEPNYQYVAARLLLFGLYKSLYPEWKTFGLVHIYYHITRFKNKYDSLLFDNYTKEDWDVLNEVIDHSKDYKFTYASLQQLIDKYLIQDRSTGFVYETPQYAYMLIAATVFHDYPVETRLSTVIDYYHAISDHEINLPTPIMSGVRTKQRNFSSCALLDCDDSTLSISANNQAVAMLTAASSGIGLNVGRMRSIGSSIRNGTVIHPGIVPFLKIFEATGKAFSQANRGGKLNCYYHIFGYEIETVIQLKNNRANEVSSVKHLDYCIQMSELFYKRFISNQNITLFCNADTPGLYDAFGTPAFDELYEKYEQDKTVRKKVVSMQKLFVDLMEQRSETARIYIMNVDHANTHSPYLDTVYMSNLCVAPETLLLTNKGYLPIGTLEDKPVTVWNGWEWSDTVVRKTGVNQKIINIKFQDDKGNIHNIECTEYHKFFIQSCNDIIEVRAKDLTIGQNIQNWNPPEFPIDSNMTLHQYHRDWWVYSVHNIGRSSDTYCLTEPKRNRMILNGILTGNCVAPETLLLTNKGYLPIGTLEDTPVTVWNGTEWSDTVVRKTGVNQKLVTVKFDNQITVECTPYHKFPIMSTEYRRTGYSTKYEFICAAELRPGDKLIKCDYPIISGDVELEYAYENGFYSGGGCLVGEEQRIYLYHQKRQLKQHLNMTIFKCWYIQENQNREYGNTTALKDKFYVPTIDISISSKLKWFAGLSDSDGSVCKNNSINSRSIQICSTNLEFLKNVVLMLQTIGIHSRIGVNRTAGDYLLPANDGTGENKSFNCKTVYRLSINTNGVAKLVNLGIVFHRLKFESFVSSLTNDSTRYVNVVEIVDIGRYDDTYCLTEPKRNMVMFNGTISSQCVEIVQPSHPIKDINETGIHEYPVAVKNNKLDEFIKMTQKNEFLEYPM